MKKTSKRTINEVLSWETGENIDAEVFFKKSLEELSVYRSELQKAIEGYRDPLFVCYYCKQKVRIRGGILKTAKRKADVFHFAHLKDSEECIIKTKNKFTKEEVNRIKYNGEKESLLHRTLKEKIAESLRRNENTIGDVSKVEVEKIIKDKVISEWKKPDINAFHLNNRIAVELQLSTTWLDVITRRQHFYREQKIFILWIFHIFNINDDIRKLTYNDVIYTNNQNAFVFNEETYELSKKTNDLVLKCYYKFYSNYELELCEDWKYSFVSLAQLKFDRKRYCIYYHDSKKQKDEVLLEIEEEEKKLLEEQRKKRIKEQQKREKLERLNSTINYLKKKLENKITNKNVLISKTNELTSKTNEMYRKVEKEEEFLTQIDKYTQETIKYLSSDNYYIRPFYDEDELLENIKKKYKDQLITISKVNSKLNNRNDVLKKNIEAIDRLDTVEISGVKYQSLNNKVDWNYITKNFSQVKVIEKSDVDSLFAESELKPISGQYELNRLQFSDTKLFLIDFSSKRNEFESELSDNKQTISDQLILKRKIFEDVERLLLEFKKAKINSIQSQTKEILDIQDQLNGSIQKNENEIHSLNQEITVANKKYNSCRN